MKDQQQTTSIVTLTLNPSIDVNTSVESVIPERKLRCERPTREPGGGGINVSRAIRNLGGEALAIVATGGRVGEMLVELLEKDSIPVTAVPVGGDTRETLNVFEKASTLQYRFIMPGPEFSSDAAVRVLDAVRALETPPGYIISSGSLPEGVGGEFHRTLADYCLETGVRLVIDTSREALASSLGPGVFLVKPNLDEFRTLIGDEAADDRQIERAVRELTVSGAAEVIFVSLGSGGAIVGTRDSTFRVHAPTVRIQSKVGAGDSTVAGMVLALTRGLAVEDAARFGVAAGAAAVMTAGTELCRRHDAERLYEGMKR